MSGIISTELDRAVEEHRNRVGPAQPGLPGVVGTAAADVQLPARNGPGRPKGSINLTTRQLGEIYRDRYGDPLEIATRIGAKNVLDEDEVHELSRVWGCTRFEAVKLWASINADANRYHHQQMPRAVILPPGAPGGERVLVEVDGIYQEFAADDDDAADREAA